MHNRELFDKDPSVYAERTLDKRTEGYYIYKCIDGERTGLERNHYFHHVEGARVYGDAFIFNVDFVDEVHGELRAVFGGMGFFYLNFVHQKHGWAREIATIMAEW